jgi:hypothetical protein
MAERDRRALGKRQHRSIKMARRLSERVVLSPGENWRHAAGDSAGLTAVHSGHKARKLVVPEPDRREEGPCPTVEDASMLKTCRAWGVLLASCLLAPAGLAAPIRFAFLLFVLSLLGEPDCHPQ